MSKKTVAKPAQPKNVPSPPVKSNSNTGFNFFKNFILLAIFGIITLVLFKANEGYTWVWNDLIHENLKFINRNPRITEAQKYQSKFGIDAAVADYIKSKTPEDAVILFPPGTVIMNDSSEYKFTKGTGGIKSRPWTTYLLYPRKLVYAEEESVSPYKHKLTHVVCMNGWGYDRIKYEVRPSGNLEILPLSQSINAY